MPEPGNFPVIEPTGETVKNGLPLSWDKGHCQWTGKSGAFPGNIPGKSIRLACLYIMNRKVFGVLNGNYGLEKILRSTLAPKGELVTYKHNGFWAPVETYRDRVNMDNLWNAGIAPWYIEK